MHHHLKGMRSISLTIPNLKKVPTNHLHMHMRKELGACTERARQELMHALRRRITVTSSLNEISTNQLGNRAVVRGGDIKK
jgi:hypothetical protein